ncbi:cytochrome p450 domain-containing protein [Phthorimaea operculella]|nr:cytochrome p450 domain-containing protein [Phthorimaea operculella]
MVLLYVCVILLLLCLYPWWRYSRARRQLSNLPCLPALPVVGNLHQLMGDGVHIFTRLSIVSKTMDYQRSPLVFWLGPIPILGVCDPLDVTAVINGYAGNPVNASELIWRRKSNLNSVPSKSMKEYQSIFSSQSRMLVAQLKTEIGRESFEINQRYVSWMTMETICQIVFGLQSTGLTKVDYQKVCRVSELYTGRNINVPILLSFLYGLSPMSKEMMKDEEVLKKLVVKMISKSNNKENLSTDKITAFDHQRIVSELITKIGAGYQTLANAITMCLLMIGSQNDVQDKLYKEIQEIFQDSDRPITNADLSRMQYCEAVIYETLRLYPFVPLYFLNADKDLKINKCTIPKNTTIWINIWGAGRARNVWGADTDIFRPERWLDSEDPGCLMTFYLDYLTGLGKDLSLAMLKTILAECVRELVIKSNTRNLRFKMSTVLEPISGHLIRVQLRE